jgi:hypothetical protein
MAGSNWLNRALFVVGILIISTGFSQEKYRAVSLEIGGTGGFGSLNYEQSFGENFSALIGKQVLVLLQLIRTMVRDWCFHCKFREDLVRIINWFWE